MKTISSAIWKETLFVLSFVLILSGIMQAVFLMIGAWNYTVLLGNLLGGLSAVANFFLMGISVQNALDKEPKAAKNYMRMSQTARMFFLFVIALIGYLLNVFHVIAVVVPYLFPRVAILIRSFFLKRAQS